MSEGLKLPPVMDPNEKAGMVYVLLFILIAASIGGFISAAIKHDNEQQKSHNR